MLRIHFTLIAILTAITLFSQNTAPAFTPAQARLRSTEARKALELNSLLKEINFRNVGPVVQSGRVSDVEVNPNDPTEMYVSYASGGLWHSRNNGTSFTPIFDNEDVMTIGDVAVDWTNNTIWVGTGEVNSSRSSYAGVGMYKSSDGGKTWEHKGLGESHHIGRVVLHPTNPDILWVAVLGHLYSPNPERGIYMTTDGGRTWQQTLKVDDNTGAVDLCIDSADPNTLYAAMWQRSRRAWNFEEGGPGSGIYKSTDGGKTWSRSTTAESGFPTGEGTGRIGVAIGYSREGKRIIWAVLDNQNAKPATAKTEDKKLLTRAQLRDMTADAFLKLEKANIEKYLSDNNFPEKYSADKVIGMVREGKISPSALVDFLEDANNDLFDTEIIGAEIYRSDDDGKTWKKTNTEYLDGLFNTYGYYFAQIRTAPYDGEKVYVLGFYATKSDDGGKTFRKMDTDNVHADHHALWINPTRRGHLINGNDGGLNISYDDGETWVKCNTPPVGQCYAINYDLNKPTYNVYCGLQDNGVWVGPSSASASDVSWQQSGHNDFKEIMGGDGMQIQIDPRNSNIVYTGYQFGYYYRLDRATGDGDAIHPAHELGERPLRFNWQTPIWLSRHQPDILYLGSNKLHRSLDGGKTWEALSGDLTLGGLKGNVPYGTITSICESPHKFGVLYVGTDDGLIHITRDGGATFTRITKGLPTQRWVSRVWVSSHDAATVYTSLNGYRWDDMNSYVYVSHDYGQNWTRIGDGLPAEPVNVIKDDPANDSLLYVGTDHGLYISLDAGRSFNAMGQLPKVAVHDLALQPQTADLIVGTHGRSIYIANMKHAQQLTDTILNKPLWVFDMPNTRYRANWGKKYSIWSPLDTPTVKIPLFAQRDGKCIIRITNEKNILVNEYEVNATRGMNYLQYNLSIGEKQFKDYSRSLNDASVLKKADNGLTYLQPGKYKITVAQGAWRAEHDWTVEEKK